ncbi:MAG: EamA family transporter [Azospirillum sp.]|nr:EamA family transporter [Azospirillum sp.]
MTVAALVLVMVLSDAAGDVLLARAMKQTGPIGDLRPGVLLATAARVAGNPNFTLGIAMATLHFGCFLALLSFAEFSFVIPAAALVYVASTLGARWVLHERVSPRRWLGILLVCAGVALVSLP